MCAVSQVYAWGQTINNWTLPTWQVYQELIAKSKILDEQLGLLDCEDPNKTIWMKSVEDRLKNLEESKR